MDDAQKQKVRDEIEKLVSAFEEEGDKEGFVNVLVLMVEEEYLKGRVQERAKWQAVNRQGLETMKRLQDLVAGLVLMMTPPEGKA